VNELAAASFDDVYRRHAPSVHRRARQLLGNDADAHETVQDLFMSLYERPEQFSGKSTLTTWLYSATTHACLNRLRNQKNRARLLREEPAPGEASTGPSAADLSNLHALLTRMPPPLGDLAVYYYFDELSYDEIATLLDCSRRKVGYLLQSLEQWIAQENGHG
jgi:RNA polymerase sigma factor (sigma-70 family)